MPFIPGIAGIGCAEVVGRVPVAGLPAGVGAVGGCTCGFAAGTACASAGADGVSGISDDVLSASASAGIVTSTALVIGSCVPTTRSSSIRAVQ